MEHVRVVRSIRLPGRPTFEVCRQSDFVESSKGLAVLDPLVVGQAAVHAASALDEWVDQQHELPDALPQAPGRCRDRCNGLIDPTYPIVTYPAWYSQGGLRAHPPTDTVGLAYYAEAAESRGSL